MRKVIYAMNVSLDGFIEDPTGAIDWSALDEELHQFFNDQEYDIDTHLYGRGMYEIMSDFWPTADLNPSAPAYVVEYARLWKRTPKIVFSRTLEQVGENAMLVRDNIADEIAKLKAQPGKDMSLGGAGIAASFMRLDLIDEYQVYIHPIVLGGGKPMFPELDAEISLQLAETRTFGSGVVLLRYRREGTS